MIWKSLVQPFTEVADGKCPSYLESISVWCVEVFTRATLDHVGELSQLFLATLTSDDVNVEEGHDGEIGCWAQSSCWNRKSHGLRP